MKHKFKASKRARCGAGALCLLVLACAYGVRPPRIIDGQDFPIDEARAVYEDMSAQSVRQALGEPLEVERLDNQSERWRYYMRERKNGITYILGFIPKRTVHFIWDYELVLTMVEGRVSSAEYQAVKIR